MTIINRFAAFVALIAISAPGWTSPQTADFAAARDAFVEHSRCGEPKQLAPGKDHGEMATCVIGHGGTVVWEVEKSMTDDKVQRIRFTWFDFAVDDPTEAKRLAPHVDSVEAEQMLDAIKGAPLLKGVRGQEGVDRASLANLILRLSQLVTDLPEIQEMDLNPVIVHQDGCSIADARIILS